MRILYLFLFVQLFFWRRSIIFLWTLLEQSLVVSWPFWWAPIVKVLVLDWFGIECSVQTFRAGLPQVLMITFTVHRAGVSPPFIVETCPLWGRFLRATSSTALFQVNQFSWRSWKVYNSPFLYTQVWWLVRGVARTYWRSCLMLWNRSWIGVRILFRAPNSSLQIFIFGIQTVDFFLECENLFCSISVFIN